MAWYVMRDLTRANATRPAWKDLSEAGFRIYTPLTWKVRKRGPKSERVQEPVIHDLLFVCSSREELDPVVAKRATLQYRFQRGAAQGTPMTVSDAEMERFIRATSSSADPRYFMPSELTASMIGRKVQIIGGPLDGMSGHLLSIKGMRKRRLIVELPGMLTAAVEVQPDYIQFV